MSCIPLAPARSIYCLGEHYRDCVKVRKMFIGISLVCLRQPSTGCSADKIYNNQATHTGSLVNRNS